MVVNYPTPTERAVDRELAALDTALTMLATRAWSPEQLQRFGRILARADAIAANRYNDQGCRCTILRTRGGELHELGCTGGAR